MKRNVLTSVLMLINVLCVYSQTLTVTDKKTKQTIPGVVIYAAKDLGNAVVTNAKGQADISMFKNEEKIEISVIGYKREIKSYAQLEAMSFSVFLTYSEFNLDEVVVSATRWSQESKNIPSKISTISAKDIALQNSQTAADLLGSSGEVFIQKSQQGGGSPMIRGFSTNRLLYTIDGVRMNNAIFRAGNLQNVISLDPLATESAEVFFGPGSIIYGSDAIGGVMSFQTLTPTMSVNSDEPLISGKAVTRYSSANNEKTGHFDIGVGWKKWAMLTSFTSSDYGDLKMGSKGPDEYLRTFYVQRIDSVDRVVTNDDPRIQRPTGYSQINMMQKVRFKPTEKWDFQYGFHYSETSKYSRYDRLIEVAANGLPRSAVWNYGPQKWMMNQLTVSHKHKNVMYDFMAIRVAQQYFEESRIDRNYSGGNRFRLRTQQEEVQAYSFNADFEKKMNKHTLFYGIEAVQNDVKSIGSAIDIRDGNLISTPDRYPASTWESYAGYVNYQFRASDKLLAQAGVRYSQYAIQSDFTRHLAFYPFDFTTAELNNNATNASVGLVYSPSETWKISAAASTGFRAPNVDDIGKIFDFAAGEVIVPNANLKAEYAYNGEINISKVIKDVVKLDATGYYTQLDNAMVRREFQVAGQDSILYNGSMSRVYAIQNAAFANVYGFHLGVEIKLPKGFGVSSRYNYQKGIEELNDGTQSPSRHAAPPFGISKLTYTYDKLKLQLYAVYSSGVSHENLNPEEQQKPAIYAKDADGNPYSPSWYTLNFKGLYQFTDNLTVSSGLENITDQRYRPYSSGLVAPGRNFIISLKCLF